MRQKLFLDFDNTIVNSTKAVCSMYNKYFKGWTGFTRAKWENSRKWDFSDVCPLASREWVDNSFKQGEFFYILETFDNVMKYLEQLNHIYDIYIVTIGEYMNLSYKSLYIEDTFPFIDNTLLIKNADCNMDKSVIDMSGGILVDDNLENLKTSNADKKIVYGVEAEYNITTEYPRAQNWNELWNMLKR